MAEQAANTCVAPFAGMFVHPLQLFEPGGQMALQAIFARFDVGVFRANGHLFCFVASGKKIQAANDYDYDQGKNQVT